MVTSKTEADLEDEEGVLGGVRSSTILEARGTTLMQVIVLMGGDRELAVGKGEI
jgi:hypothetical protein